MSKSKVFVISDTHFPFHSKAAYKKLMAIIKKEKPTHVVQIGDLLDQYVFSRYPKSASITPNDDITVGLKHAVDMWAQIRKMLPKAKCHQLIGNHDVRLAKRIAERVPELSSFFSHKDMYKFPGVKIVASDRDYLEIDGVVYVHGWLGKSIDHAMFFGKPTVHGHRHRAEISTAGPRLWSLDVGYLADKDSLPLQYTASKHSKWTLACGVVEDGKPRLVFL